MDLSVYIENFHFSGCFFSLVVRIFTSTLVYVVDLMVRYIYGKPGRWEGMGLNYTILLVHPLYTGKK